MDICGLEEEGKKVGPVQSTVFTATGAKSLSEGPSWFICCKLQGI